MKSLMVLAISVVLSATAAFADDRRRSAADRAESPIVVAQACGWYVISGCYRGWNQAQNRARKIGAFVVDTSSGAYPNFRPGWFCAAFGPYDQWTAKSKSRYFKPSYIKNAC